MAVGSLLVAGLRRRNLGPRGFNASGSSDDLKVRSRNRKSHEVASFHGALRVDIPHMGGSITALAFLNETLVVFRERAIYMLPGDGFAGRRPVPAP